MNAQKLKNALPVIGIVLALVLSIASAGMTGYLLWLFNYSPAVPANPADTNYLTQIVNGLNKRVNKLEQNPAPQTPPSETRDPLYNEPIVRDQLIQMLDEKFSKEHVIRGGNKTALSFLTQYGFSDFQIRNSILDKFPTRSFDWNSLNSAQGSRLNQVFFRQNNGSALGYSFSYQTQFGSAPYIKDLDKYCDGKSDLIKQAVYLMHAMPGSYGDSQLNVEQACAGIKAFDASGKPVDLLTASTSTDDIYQLVYIQKSVSADNGPEGAYYSPAAAFIVMETLAGQSAQNVFEISAIAINREELLNEKDTRESEQEIPEMVDDILKSAHPAQCDYGYGSCY